MKSKIGFMQGRLVESEKKNSIQYFPEKNWIKELKIAHKNGFNIMEWTINAENIIKNPLYNGNLKRLLKAINKYRIKIPSITLDYFMQEPFYKKIKLKNKSKIILNLKKIITNGNKIGIKYFIFPLVDNSSLKNRTEEELLTYEIKKLLKLLNKDSKILFEIDYPPKKIIRFLRKFKSQKIGINYDTGNSAGLGFDFNQEIKYVKFIKNIHIKDRVLKGNSIRLGEGNWDYKKFFKLIRNNYKGNFILQTARAKNNKHVEEINLNRNFILNECK
tara:strand:- start:4611 stop:5432 length:822 start_codon:yes stop_codon:yes gene_type:complete